MDKLVKRFELLFVFALFVTGTLFLLRIAYLPIWVSTPIGLGLLLALRSFVHLRYQIKIPFALLTLMLLAIEVDAIGNLFGWYNQRFRFVQYDELSHCLVSALLIPVVVWLVQTGLNRYGYRLPIGLICFLSFATVFTLAGFYEVIELWDDKYLHAEPGWRIHGSYDTANDLQWDLLGMGTGAIVSYVVLRSRKVGLRAEQRGGRLRSQ